MPFVVAVAVFVALVPALDRWNVSRRNRKSYLINHLYRCFDKELML